MFLGEICDPQKIKTWFQRIEDFDKIDTAAEFSKKPSMTKGETETQKIHTNDKTQ